MFNTNFFRKANNLISFDQILLASDTLWKVGVYACCNVSLLCVKRRYAFRLNVFSENWWVSWDKNVSRVLSKHCRLRKVRQTDKVSRREIRLTKRDLQEMRWWSYAFIAVFRVGKAKMWNVHTCLQTARLESTIVYQFLWIVFC